MSPILSNIVLDRLDKYVETQMIPAYTRGQHRKTYPPYVQLTKQALQARRQGEWHHARQLRQQAQQLPSRDPGTRIFDVCGTSDTPMTCSWDSLGRRAKQA